MKTPVQINIILAIFGLACVPAGYLFPFLLVVGFAAELIAVPRAKRFLQQGDRSGSVIAGLVLSAIGLLAYVALLVLYLAFIN